MKEDILYLQALINLTDRNNLNYDEIRKLLDKKFKNKYKRKLFVIKYEKKQFSDLKFSLKRLPKTIQNKYKLKIKQIKEIKCDNIKLFAFKMKLIDDLLLKLLDEYNDLNCIVSNIEEKNELEKIKSNDNIINEEKIILSSSKDKEVILKEIEEYNLKIKSLKEQIQSKKYYDKLEDDDNFLSEIIQYINSDTFINNYYSRKDSFNNYFNIVSREIIKRIETKEIEFQESISGNDLNIETLSLECLYLLNELKKLKFNNSNLYLFDKIEDERNLANNLLNKLLELLVSLDDSNKNYDQEIDEILTLNNIETIKRLDKKTYNKIYNLLNKLNNNKKDENTIIEEQQESKEMIIEDDQIDNSKIKWLHFFEYCKIKIMESGEINENDLIIINKYIDQLKYEFIHLFKTTLDSNDLNKIEEMLINADNLIEKKISSLKTSKQKIKKAS